MSRRDMQFAEDAGVLYSATATCKRVKSTLEAGKRDAMGQRHSSLQCAPAWVAAIHVVELTWLDASGPPRDQYVA